MLISFPLYHFLTSVHESKWAKGSSLRDIKQIEQIMLLNWGRTSKFIDFFFLFGFRCPFLISMSFRMWFLILECCVSDIPARYLKIAQLHKCTWILKRKILVLSQLFDFIKANSPSIPSSTKVGSSAPPKPRLALGWTQNNVVIRIWKAAIKF